ncbi:hypothetical protein SASPL_129897 [Salvia splendens]|uniref:Somatic embryogenesis receptor kinase 4 n=1 Tax=Salvia splendens TaxID=180675 RepID=A0A8X8XGY8_SALSN|nr:hypothetical protein SASPL_129897 [Salvia splendens]
MAARGLLVFCALAVVLLLMPKARGNSEGDALHALRRSLTDPDNVLQSWDPNLVNPCTWFHITCNQGNRVTRVDLGNSNLSGHLVPELGKLEYLQYLELYKNNIQGEISAELGNLKSLISLDLYNNNISGKIPPSLGNLKSLVFLRLNDNKLRGPIPRTLAGISTLKVVSYRAVVATVAEVADAGQDVSNNNLCGTIPSSGPFEHIPLNKFVDLSFVFAALRTTPDSKVRSCRVLQVTTKTALNPLMRDTEACNNISLSLMLVMYKLDCLVGCLVL